MSDTIKKRYVIQHTAGKCPIKKSPVAQSHEGVIRLLIELMTYNKDSFFTVCEITWDDDLWVTAGAEYLGEHDIMAGSLFVPLKAEYFEAFERGDKDTEYRPYGPRWNERTCPLYRPVTLSYGYGKKRRLQRRIAETKKCEPTPDFIKIYGTGKECFAIRMTDQATEHLKRWAA